MDTGEAAADFKFHRLLQTVHARLIRRFLSPECVNSALKQRCGVGLGLVGVVHTRRRAVQRPRDDCTIGAMTVPRRALRCGSPSGAVRAAVAVVEPYRPQPWLARVK